MKIEFKENDSIYKIVQTIKKIPNYKKATVDIHPDHRIFQHQRRSNYLKNLIEEHNLDITFVSHNISSKNYRKQADLSHTDIFDKKFWEKITNTNKIREKINSYHRSLLIKKNYLSGFVLLSELWVLLVLLYVFWTLLSPNATIIVTPAYEVDHVVYNFRYYPIWDKQVHQFQSYLSVPYYTWSVPYLYDMSLNVQNVSYTAESAVGTIEIQNTYDYTYSLLNNSTLITEDKVLYKTQKRVDVPPGSLEKPGTARVQVVAEENFENWELIWELWNIPKWKKLYFRNSAEEEREKVRAVSWNNFEWWETIETGTVIEEDIETMEASILEQMEKNKSSYLKTKIDQTEDVILLPFEDLYNFDVKEFITTSEVWEATSFIEGKVETQLYYPYITWTELKTAVEQFLTQRSENDANLTQYDRNGITMFDRVEVFDDELLPPHFLIPTKIPVIKTYNIQNDSLGVINEIKDRIVWVDKETAQKIILGYDEIDGIKINISPRWFSIIPSVKSRIKFKFEG